MESGLDISNANTIIINRADRFGLAQERQVLVQRRVRDGTFGVGRPARAEHLVGEGPGENEDLKGEPFVGRAGQLLNAMLLAMGFERAQVFIANILKCRPPNNRDPRPEEAKSCEPFLLRQIALIEPKVILSAGRISAQNLLQTDIPVGKLRGRVHGFGTARIPLVVTYHPAYLLRAPAETVEQISAFLGVTRNDAEVALMRSLKQALDPKGLLNPGRIF